MRGPAKFERVNNALHTKVDTNDAGAVVTPLFQSSAFDAHSPYFYSRKDNPNVRELEETVSALEDAKFAIAVSTGMAAVASVAELLPPRATVVLNTHTYGCTVQFFKRLADAGKVALSIMDLSTARGIESIPQNADMIFFETPTNPFLKTVSIAQVRKTTNRDCLLVVDNTWATPLHQQPLKHAADISLHSATKFMSGHSDVMGGLILTDNEALNQRLRDIRFYGGAVLSPHSAWLIRRSLQTLEIRMRSHREVTREMAAWLTGNDEIEQVYYPNTGDGQLEDYGGILFFQFKQPYDYVAFRNSLKIFGTGTGMAAVTSMVAQPYTGSHASIDACTKSEMGLNEGLVRLCFGLESPELLRNDISQAISHMRNAIR